MANYKIQEILMDDGRLEINDSVKKYLNKVYNKDRGSYNHIIKAITKIYDNPEFSETLTGFLSGYRSKHVGNKVIIYRCKDNCIQINNIDEHDKAYGLH
ncbi:hypothetical protein M1112_02465 [Candidatus Parvarchaeota archaeon]|jgi:mRNA-degrading endonuclease YafQ of YafQ-DinJ toxin-antitoxin module|nr:hypothetical protein [Candidatus Parvarchaeota archaeon]